MLQPLKVDLGSAQQDNYLQHILTPLEGGRLRVPCFWVGGMAILHVGSML